MSMFGKWAAQAKGWRTMALSFLLAIIGVLEAADWAQIVAPHHVGPVMLVVGFIIAVLRVVTDTPVGCRREDGKRRFR